MADVVSQAARHAQGVSKGIGTAVISETRGGRNDDGRRRDDHDDRPQQGVHPFVVEPAWGYSLVDDVALLEEELPRRHGGADDRNNQQDAARRRSATNAGNGQPVHHRRSVGLRHEEQGND